MSVACKILGHTWSVAPRRGRLVEMCTACGALPDDDSPEPVQIDQERRRQATNSVGGTTDTLLETQRPTEAHRLLSIVHEARNVLWSSHNGGYAGRPSEVSRLLEAVCDEVERVWGAP